MKFVLIFSLLSFSVLAQSVTDCLNAFNKLGDGSGNDLVPSYCIEEIQQLNDTHLKATYSDENKDLVFSAYKNAIIMEDRKLNKVFVTSGESTLLKDISKIYYDHKNDELFVFDKNLESVLVFNTLIPGNVAPYRVIHTDETIHIIDMIVKDSKLYLLTANKELVSFDREINSKAREGYRKDKVQTRSIASQNAISLEIVNSEVLAK